jgi:general stress protein 26
VNIEEVYHFMHGERLGVLATTDPVGRPEAALMGYAVTPELEIIFDTVKTSRKYPNIMANPRVAWVFGCSSEITVQYEGVARELEGEELTNYKKTYFAAFPDGSARESWPDITYFVVRPKWVRYCDYNPGQRRIEEQKF